MNSKIIYCFDLEMCCWDIEDKETGKTISKTGEIIEIGVCRLNLTTGMIDAKKSYYVKPEKDEISEFCVSLTGITQELVDKEGTSLAEALDRIENDLGGKLTSRIFFSWGDDGRWLEDECKSKGIEPLIIKYFNAKILYMISIRLGNKRMDFSKALKNEGLEFIGRAHSGADDAYNLARLVQKFI